MKYDYECTNCKKQFEVEHPISETPEIMCTECDNPARRIISRGTNFVLKGGGWYNDLYSSTKDKQ